MQPHRQEGGGRTGVEVRKGKTERVSGLGSSQVSETRLPGQTMGEDGVRGEMCSTPGGATPWASHFTSLVTGEMEGWTGARDPRLSD